MKIKSFRGMGQPHYVKLNNENDLSILRYLKTVRETRSVKGDAGNLCMGCGYEPSTVFSFCLCVRIL